MSNLPLDYARQRYADFGVDMDRAVAALGSIALSIHCWQGDDVGGFETNRQSLDGGIAVTGNYPGKARTPDELRQDFDFARTLIPGQHRFNLHASYAETNGKHVDRNAITIEHFQTWIDWAKSLEIKLDFNPTYFSHPLSSTGFTLSSADDRIRNFWIDHGVACRQIAAEMGRQLRSPCANNVWIPDGSKDIPIDRAGPRARLIDSLDRMFATKYPETQLIDAVESKLFGIGSESYVVGSHEFYLGYAVSRQKYLCLDAGHFHPTESIADKISAVMTQVPGLVLHVSRGVRWDSDHVVLLDDPTLDIARELVRGSYLNRTCIGLDFFDASINRVAAWIIGTRSTLKALLIALLEPIDQLRTFENTGDYTQRLALLEEAKTLPWSIVWNHYCETQGVPPGFDWMNSIKHYEQTILSKR
ncbi:L-rhamnose isomerase [Lacunimicrobium album]